MKRTILGFHRDADSDWVAELDCGHGRHTRHNPPLAERSWVLTPEGRESQRGAVLDCARCDRREVPEGYQPYQRTPRFDESTAPDALLAAHTTKRGVWALIRVLRGKLEYHIGAPFHEDEVLTSASPGVIVPEVPHHVAPSGAVEFFVEFWRPGVGAT